MNKSSGLFCNAKGLFVIDHTTLFQLHFSNGINENAAANINTYLFRSTIVNLFGEGQQSDALAIIVEHIVQVQPTDFSC